MNLKIAVISDLHCHSKTNNGNIQESYLLTDQAIPTNQNPLESFKKLINEKTQKGGDFSVDLLIMPGDITNKCDQDGYSFGWSAVKEIGSLLKAKMILPTIGNHDVDSRNKYSSSPFEKAKTFSSDFPFTDDNKNDEFWKKGFAFIDGANFRILVINSAVDHTSPSDAEHGNISQDTINLIEDELSALSANQKRFNIAICHHHPIPHERHYLGTSDVLFNGTVLADLLAQYDYQIIIHGHKHDPLLRYAPGGANSPIVFASGSFSAYKTLLLQGAYNTFHIITLDEIDKVDCENQGHVETWFFTPSKGWDHEVSNEYFLPKAGFGCRTSIRNLATRIHTWFQGQNEHNFQWAEFIANFEMIDHLLPSDQKKLGDMLSSLKIVVYPHFPFRPEIISFNP